MTEATGTPTSDDLARMALELRNWGRWGEEDERGALNLITDAKRAQAAALVQEGVSVSCARPLPVMPSMENPTPVQHHMISGGDASTADDRFGIARDYFAIAPHGMATTHLDALCHIFYEGKMYNGFDKSEVRTDGAKKNSIMAGADGIVSRGVLLEIPPVRDAQWLEPMQNITIAELEAAESAAGRAGGGRGHPAGGHRDAIRARNRRGRGRPSTAWPGSTRAACRGCASATWPSSAATA